MQAVAAGIPETMRGWVRYRDWFEIRQMRLRELGPSDVLVRNLAAQACYTLAPNVDTSADAEYAVSPGHGAAGVVAAVGSQVRRVAVGDRVITPPTAVCGTCYSCLRGEWAACGYKGSIDWTDRTSPANPPFARLDDDTPVWQDHTGGFAEYAICQEAYVVPIYNSALSDVELSVLSCAGGSGWEAALIGMPVTIGSSVAVFGAGPLGLAVIQAARMMGARPIVAVERLPHRMAAAKEAGAHVVLDADELGADVVSKIQEICAPETENMAAGGKPFKGFYHGRGADHVYEATGRTIGEPSTGKPADPTGSAPVAWGVAATRRGGTFVHTGWTAPSDDPHVWAPSPGPFFYEARRYLSQPFTNILRDIPRLAKIIESGHLNAQALVDPVLPFEQGDTAIRHSYDRDRLLPIITYQT